jgi:hypothetical protein
METITARRFPTPCTKHNFPRGVSTGTADRAAFVSAGFAPVLTDAFVSAA